MANMKSLPVKELDRYVRMLSRRTGKDYEIDRTSAGYRLARDGGATMVSPRLTKQEFTVYIDACLAMVDDLGVSPNPGRKVREAPTGRKVYASHKRDGRLTTSGRRALPRTDFALPPGPEEQRRGIKGRLPIEDEPHARAALSRASEMHHRGELTKKQLRAVQRKIEKRYPGIDVTVTNPPEDDRGRLVETQKYLMEKLWRESEKDEPDRVRLRGLWNELHEVNDRIVREFSGPVRRPPMRGNPPPARGQLLGYAHSIRYLHSGDGHWYEHDFGEGDELRTMPDGSLRIENPRRKLWRDFP